MSGSLDDPVGVVLSGEVALTVESSELRRGLIITPATKGVEVVHFHCWITKVCFWFSAQPMLDSCLEVILLEGPLPLGGIVDALMK